MTKTILGPGIFVLAGLTACVSYSNACRATGVENCSGNMAGGPSVSERFDFKTVANDFLTAVATRDEARFLTYFKHDLPFYAVLPGGKTFDRVDAFLESQHVWFRGTTGRFTFQIREAYQAGDQGLAFANVIYENTDAEGRKFRLTLYLSFVFTNVGGRWYLVHDQNSVIAQIFL